MSTHSASRRAPRYGLVVALVTLGVGAVGVAPALAKSSPTTPYSSKVAGTVTATGPGAFSLKGLGVALPLGAVTETGTVQITSSDSNGVLNDVLTETLTAVNGDTLVLRCAETATPVKPGVYHGVDSWTVVGGTGRYAHATGSGTGTTNADLNAGTYSKSELGTITLG